MALKLSIAAATRHHRKVVRLIGRRNQMYREWVVQGSALWRKEERSPSAVDGPELAEREEDAQSALSLPIGEGVLPMYLAHQAYEKARASYPEALQRVMPTRFGNVLRQSEDRAGKQYGLDTIAIAPHISLVAKPEHYAYVQDRQKVMDLAITMCLVSALATGMSAVLLVDDGWWSLLSFVPFGIAYASYVGAVAAARSYNVAIETVSDLSRFALYDALRIAQPATGEEERQMARELMKLLQGTPWPAMRLKHPDPPPTKTSYTGPDGSAMPADGTSPID